MKSQLTIERLLIEAKAFAEQESQHSDSSLFGVTDGKAVGTYLEHKFKQHLSMHYTYDTGNSARGIDFPELEVDIKVTSIMQPQSSCPFKSARQKIFGLGYSLIVFVYRKIDDPINRLGTLNILHAIFVDKSRTADYQTTRGLYELINNDGNIDDLVAFMMDRNLPLDEIEAQNIAGEILDQRALTLGYLTISNALQWRLQYSRVIEQAGSISGIHKVR